MKPHLLLLFILGDFASMLLIILLLLAIISLVAVCIIVPTVYRKRLQRLERKKSDDSLALVVDSLSIPVRIVERKSYTVLFANNASLALFGFDSLDEMRKHTLKECLHYDENTKERAFETLDRLVKSDKECTEKLDFITPDGRIVNAKITTCSIIYNEKSCKLAIIMDLEKENAIKRMRRELQTIVDMLPVAIRIVDNKTKSILYGNNAAAEIFGVQNAADFFGKSSMLFVPDKQNDGKDSYQKLAELAPTSDTPFSTEFTLKRLDGTLFDAYITACEVEYNGTKSSLGIVRDLTEEKEYQRKLAMIAQKERETNQLKSRFLANMSHEIRTPMNVIIGLTEIELHKDIKDDTLEIYKKINISAKNLLAIINDILDITKIEENKLELYEEEFELEEVLNSALLVASPRLEGKNVEFVFNGALELPRYLIGDRTRLWQILKNFLDNSAKYTEEGIIVLTVYVDNDHSNDEVATINFVVEDSGIGMDEEQLQRLFVPYEQIFNNAQRQYKGTGLGMVISQQLCNLMGGTLKVESQLGKGTIVRMSIPFARSDNRETGFMSTRSNVLVGKRVLAVDDERISREIMNRILRSCHADCVMVSSGTEALKTVIEYRDRGEFFDIILLDYMMDDLNGLETAKQITLSLSIAPKLLMVTAYQKYIAEKELEKNGIDGLIEKPFIPSHFIDRILQALGIESEQERIAEYSKYENVTVLVCDDYPLNLEVASGMLGQFGIKTLLAENGKQAIEILHNQSVDLVFMDIQMPIMDGITAATLLRKDSRFDDLPIISLTADAMKESVEKCLAAGMNDHIAKPIQFSKLSAILQKWLPESKAIKDSTVDFSGQSEVLVRFGGSKEFFERALMEFRDILPEQWEDYSTAVQAAERTLKFLHKLKGAAGTLDIKDIYKYASWFEESMRACEPSKEVYGQLVEASMAARKRIGEQFVGVERVELPLGSREELMSILKELKESLEEYTPHSADLVDKLRKKCFGGVDQAQLEELCTLSERYEFDAALEVLDLIMGENNE